MMSTFSCNDIFEFISLYADKFKTAKTSSICSLKPVAARWGGRSRPPSPTKIFKTIKILSRNSLVCPGN